MSEHQDAITDGLAQVQDPDYLGDGDASDDEGMPPAHEWSYQGTVTEALANWAAEAPGADSWAYEGPDAAGDPVMACHGGFIWQGHTYTVRMHIHVGAHFILGWALGGMWVEGVVGSGINITDDVHDHAAMQAVGQAAYAAHTG